MRRGIALCLICLLLCGLCSCAGRESAIPADRTVLRMASWLPTGIEKIVQRFNESQKDVYIELVSWQEPSGEVTDSVDRMNADLVATQPDLYHTVSIDAAKLRNAGLIADWYPLLATAEGFDPKEYQTHIWELLETDGALYQLAVSFSIFGVGGISALYDGQTGWTIVEFESFLAAHQGELYTTQDRMLQLMLWYGSHMDFIDRGTLSCDFESPEFLQMLDFWERLPAVPQEGAEVSAAWVQGAANHYSDRYGDELYTRVVGAPSRHGTGPAVALGDSFALSSVTEHPEACLVFIEWLLSAQTQRELYLNGYNIPIRTEVWEESLERAQLGGEEERSLFYGFTTGTGQFTEDGFVPDYVMGLPSAEAAYLRELVADIDRVAEGFFDYKEVTKVVEEEVLAFLAGDKTKEDCARLIQDRVSTMLAELR